MSLMPLPSNSEVSGGAASGVVPPDLVLEGDLRRESMGAFGFLACTATVM